MRYHLKARSGVVLMSLCGWGIIGRLTLNATTTCTFALGSVTRFAHLAAFEPAFSLLDATSVLKTQTIHVTLWCLARRRRR